MIDLPALLARAQRPLLMGIVNVTPDSFSDGGRYLSTEQAIAHGLALRAEGADILDIGGESTRPGSDPVSAEDERARVLPVIAGLKNCGALLSIDTMKPAVAQAAVDTGAHIWNDVTGLSFAPDSMAMAAALKVPVIVMHMQSAPKTMQQAPSYPRGVLTELTDFFTRQASLAQQAGVERRNIWIDPGIGFGKSLDHNLTIMRQLRRLTDLGFPLVFGASRKSFIAKIEALDATRSDATSSADDRLGGSLAAALWAARAGAPILRVHDVGATRQMLDIWQAINASI